MNEWAIAVAAGIGATITPCVLPLYPAFLAYITAPQAVAAGGPAAASSRPSPAAAAVMVWLGVVVGMVAIGALVAALSLGLGSVLRVIVPLADLLLIAPGPAPAALAVTRSPGCRRSPRRRWVVAARWPARSCTACCSRRSPCPAPARS